MQELKGLQGKRLDGFSLDLGEVKQLRLSGWKGFKLYLRDNSGRASESPVIQGIYSVGGKDGVKAWMDLEYTEELEFVRGAEIKDKLSLETDHLNRKLFKYLGNIIPPGGHLMVSYEGEQNIHVSTRIWLNKGIPPVLTPLGVLIFLAGFQYIKDWYLAEGGHEGPRKLWGEKAPDKSWTETFYERTAQQIGKFMEKRAGTYPKEIEDPARHKATEILEAIKKI